MEGEPCLLRGSLNSPKDAPTGATATDIALKRPDNRGLVGSGVLLEQGHTCQDHPRGAVATLKGIFKNGARSAARLPTVKSSARKVEVFAQDMQQAPFGRGRYLALGSIDLNLYCFCH